MTPLARFLVDGAGYDAQVVDRLRGKPPQGEETLRRIFITAGVLTLLSSILCGVGAGYGMWLTDAHPVSAILVGLAASLVLWNLFRLFHSGTGFPMHYPIEALEEWWPGKASLAVFSAFGALFAQPTVLLVMKPLLDRTVALRESLAVALGGHAASSMADGLIFRAHAAWEQPLVAAPITAFFGLLISSPAWLRFFTIKAVRAYEREKWIEERMLVDDAFATAQDDITRLLDEVPGFAPPLQIHYADPPYNTRPLVFGLDLYAIGPSGGFYRAHDEPAPPPIAPPKDEPAPPPVRDTAKLPPKPAAGGEEVASAWDDPVDDAKSEPPAKDYFEMGRAQAKRAKDNLAKVAPFVALMVDKPIDEVERTIQSAPDDARLHQLFPDYKKLRSVLLKNAGFAIDHGMAPILAVIVQKPRADVEKRLAAAPRDKKLTGVFAPELARRLLGKKI